MMYAEKLFITFLLMKAINIQRDGYLKNESPMYSNICTRFVIHYGKKVPTPAFSPCHRKRSKIGTEVKLGSTVASMCWGEQPAIETTTSVDILVLNYVVYT